MRLALLAAALVTGGCWTGSAAPPPPVVANAPPPRAKPRPAPRAPFPDRSTWTGTYECTQGVTAVQLAIEVDGARVTATFDFGATADNPTVPNGSYQLRGNLHELPDAVALELVPERWISHPPGYAMVGLSLRGDIRHRRLKGTIDNPGCTWIDVRRAD